MGIVPASQVHPLSGRRVVLWCTPSSVRDLFCNGRLSSILDSTNQRRDSGRGGWKNRGVFGS